MNKSRRAVRRGKGTKSLIAIFKNVCLPCNSDIFRSMVDEDYSYILVEQYASEVSSAVKSYGLFDGLNFISEKKISATNFLPFFFCSWKQNFNDYFVRSYVHTHFSGQFVLVVKVNRNAKETPHNTGYRCKLMLRCITNKYSGSRFL